MFRKSTTFTAVGAALVLALPATALGQSSSGTGERPFRESGGQAALVQSSSGSGERPFRESGGPTTTQAQVLDVHPATQAQILRGQALGRYYEGTKVDPATQAQIVRGQALGRYYQSTQAAQVANVAGPDAFERGVNTYLNSKPVEPGPVQVTNTRDIEWPQVGIGLGIGVLLMIGLFMALKGTRQRPLAH